MDIAFGRLLQTLAVLIIVTILLYFVATQPFTNDQPIKTNDTNEIISDHLRSYDIYKNESPSNWFRNRSIRSSIDKSIVSTATGNTGHTMSNKSFLLHGIIAYNNEQPNKTINSSNSKIVNSDTNRTIKNGQVDKHKNKAKRKMNLNHQRTTAINRKLYLPKNIKFNNSNRNSISRNDEHNGGGGVSSKRDNDLLHPINVFDVNGYSNLSEHKVRHKKDQVIVREDQGVVVVRKYACIPCKIIPGIPSRPSTRPRHSYRGMFFRHVVYICMSYK